MPIYMSSAEVADRFTILSIKKERFANEESVQKVTDALISFENEINRLASEYAGLLPLVTQLYAVNVALWELEAAMTDLLTSQPADNGQIGKIADTARSIRLNNKNRIAIKNQIAELVRELRSEDLRERY